MAGAHDLGEGVRLRGDGPDPTAEGVDEEDHQGAPQPVVGADLFVALALGADACLLGRPHVYGLALDGTAGVSAVVDNVLAELDLTMGLVGAASIGDITRELLVEV
ncbi:alpha-hydroxy-acid oxidizing protein [Janibacter sp. RAF20_2_2]|uniref:alpha-hydroxy-acid oxidizing protein n=1 Tax=Janibacter sp. RAF52 TaxID=3233058 RepID=UPI003F927A7C